MNARIKTYSINPNDTMNRDKYKLQKYHMTTI